MGKYTLAVVERVRQNLGLEEDDGSRDTEIEAMTRHELLDRCLAWEGIINYTQTIKGLIMDIYGVEL